MARSKASGIRQRHKTGCPGRGRCDCPWQAEVFSARDGKKIRRAFPSRDQAVSWRADAQAAVSKGGLRSPTRTTVRDAAEAFIVGASDGSIPNASGARYKPATIRGYKVGLTKRVLPAFGSKRLCMVEREDVQALADRLTAEGLAASTVQNTLDPLRVIFRRAIRRGEVSVDPTDGLELRRPSGRRERIATPAEAARLIAGAPDQWRALWATAFYAGLRRGELRALRWSAVDLYRREILVTAGWDAIEGEQTTKNDSARLVPILASLGPELEAHKAATGRDGDELVFGRTAELPFNPETLRRDTLVAWDASDEPLNPISLHEARHTCASVLIASGANAKALSRVMGHSSIQVTFDIYGHLMPGHLDEVKRLADAYLERTDGRPALRVVA